MAARTSGRFKQSHARLVDLAAQVKCVLVAFIASRETPGYMAFHVPFILHNDDVLMFIFGLHGAAVIITKL